MEKTNTLEKIETVYTYDEWLKEFVTYLCEQETEVARVNQLKRLETHRQKMKISRMEYVYYLKQKISGLVIIVIGILTPLILEGDITVSLIALPLGVFLMITREKIMTF